MPRLVLRSLPLAAIGVALLLPHWSVAGAGPDGDTPVTHVKSIEEQLAIRAEFGLSVDSTLATSLSSDESPLLGIPLSGPEVLELERRAYVQSNLLSLNQVGANFSEVFGGLWLDQAAGGVLNVALTRAASAAVRDAIAAAVPAHAIVQVRTVEYSLLELERVHSDLEEMAHREQNIGHRAIGAISTNVPLNTVDVGIAATAPATVAPDLLAMFGNRIRILDDVVLDEQACPNRFSCTPYRGGIDLYRTGGSCTSAYNAKKNGVNSYYLLTAGHCGPANAAWFHDEVQVGLMSIRAYVNQGAADAGGLGRPGTSGHKNWIFVTGGEPARPITSRQGHDADNPGESVCISGKVTGFWCGTIISDNVDNVFTGTIILNNLRSATYQSQATDSGSPIFYGNVAKGIHVGQIGATRYYTHIWEDEQALGVAVLTAPT